LRWPGIGIVSSATLSVRPLTPQAPRSPPSSRQWGRQSTRFSQLGDRSVALRAAQPSARRPPVVIGRRAAACPGRFRAQGAAQRLRREPALLLGRRREKKYVYRRSQRYFTPSRMYTHRYGRNYFRKSARANQFAPRRESSDETGTCVTGPDVKQKNTVRCRCYGWTAIKGSKVPCSYKLTAIGKFALLRYLSELF